MIKVMLEMRETEASGHFFGKVRNVPWMRVDSAERALEEARRAEGAWGKHPDFIRVTFSGDASDNVRR